MQPFRVCISDDHSAITDGIRSWLDAEPDVSVIAVATNGLETLRLVEEHRPQVLVQDIRMKDISGLEVIRRLRRMPHHSSLRILALSGSEQISVQNVLHAGANGYCSKEESRETLITALRHVATQESRYISPRALLAYTAAEEALRRAALTAVEASILAHIKAPNAEIAERLALSEGTVRNHISSIYAKLRVSSRFEAIKWAERFSLLEEE